LACVLFFKDGKDNGLFGFSKRKMSKNSLIIKKFNYKNKSIKGNVKFRNKTANV
jgi:hypothetical protein